MDKFDNKLKHKFQDASVENESWLEPSSDTYAKIEEAISKPKKKRRMFLFILSGLFLLSSALFLNHFASTKGNSELSQSKQNILNNDGNKTISNNISYSSDAEVALIPNSEENASAFIHPSKNEIYSENDTKKNDNIIGSNDDLYPLKKKLKTTTTNTNTTATTEKSQVTNSFKKTLNSTISLSPNLSTTKDKQTTDSNNQISKSAITIQRIGRLNDNFSFGPREELSANFSYSSKSKIAEGLHYLSFSAGIVNWNDRLNSNYAGALSPADFSQSTSSGYQLDLSLHRKVHPVFAVGFGVSFLDIGVKSGHNTILSYDSASETNGAQDFSDLRLATPYGFVQSDIVIGRSSANMDNTQSLNASVNSIHKIRILKLYPSLDLKLVQQTRLDLSVNFNFGYNYILSLENQLDFINTGHTDYTFENGNIISSQENLNSGFWSAALGLKLDYRFNEMYSLGAQVNWSEGLSPIFNTDDFSSVPRSQRLSVFLKYSF